jgi:hypothetical protein
MTKEKLKQLFEVSGKKNKDMMKFASDLGGRIDGNVISKHKKGAIAISRSMELNYIIFFSRYPVCWEYLLPTK